MSILDTKSSETPGNPDLSEDVILAILLRMPVKILMLCKCVCKQWCTMIESQSFIEQHFHQRQEHLLVCHYKPNEDNHVYELFVDDKCSGLEEHVLLQMPNMVDELMGPVNGVFCLVGRSGDLALLNPATRQLKPLPELAEENFEPHKRSPQNVVGFGLDPSSGDYKVVSLWYYWDKSVDGLGYHPIVLVYSLGSDSWRKLGDVGCSKSSYIACNSLCNTYLNGVYYWTMTCLGTNVAAILAFDMMTEQFQEIQVPDCCKSILGHLTIHGDSIALLSYESSGAGLCEVWVMEKEGRWNRVAVVGPFAVMYLPLCLWKNNELLVETYASFLGLYNIFTKKRQLTHARARWDVSSITWVFSYKQSLVSIKGKIDNCMLWDDSPDILSIAWPNGIN